MGVDAVGDGTDLPRIRAIYATFIMRLERGALRCEHVRVDMGLNSWRFTRVDGDALLLVFYYNVASALEFMTLGEYDLRLSLEMFESCWTSVNSIIYVSKLILDYFPEYTFLYKQNKLSIK